MSVSVTTPISQAWDRMVRLSFQPFDIVKWMCLGFSAFLMGLWATVVQGLQQGTNLFPWHQIIPMPGPGGGSNTPDLATILTAHGPTIIAWVGAGGAVLLTLYAITLFVMCRGRFMFLDGVVHNRGDIKRPWSDFAEQANALFWFKLTITIAFWGLVIAAVASALVLLWPDIKAEMLSEFGAWVIMIGVSLLTIAGLLYWKGLVVTDDFVVPMMVAQPIGPWRAWWVWLTVFLKRHVWAIILFYLLRMLFALAAGAIVQIVCCLTLCVGMLPYINSVILLPVIIFDRCYAWYFVEQFGEQWRVFPVDEDAPLCPACRYDLRGNPEATHCPECGYDVAGLALRPAE